jgi:hypothetical protein
MKPIKLKTTPAPWEWEYDDNGFYYVHAKEMPSPYICATGGESSTDVQNIKLISAAPELLLALNAIIENFPREVLKDQLNEDYELIENVIKKLTPNHT